MAIETRTGGKIDKMYGNATCIEDSLHLALSVVVKFLFIIVPNSMRFPPSSKKLFSILLNSSYTKGLKV